MGAMTTSVHGEEWSKHFTVAGKPQLRIEAGEASVELRAGVGGAIDARLTTRGWSIGPDGVRVNARQNGSRVEIEIRVPSTQWDFRNRAVRIEVSVPPQLDAEVHTGDGHIAAKGLKGAFRFTTDDGSIETDAMDGTLKARTADGRVTARGRFDELDLHTNDGSILAAAAAGSKMAAPWKIETGDGSVTVRLPEAFVADLDATTGDGGITVSLPVTTRAFRTGENTVHGKLNGGGLSLRIRTGDGAIRIDKI